MSSLDLITSRTLRKTILFICSGVYSFAFRCIVYVLISNGYSIM